jgi:hypothetical protein
MAELTDEQKELVSSEFERRNEYYLSEENQGPLQLSRLTEVVIDIAQPKGSGKDCYVVPAKLPADVVAAWLESNSPLSDDCEDCGYPLPRGRYRSCPLCRGAVGQNAYKIKHKHPGYGSLTSYGQR